MLFNTAQKVEDVVWTMKLADLPRAENRARINDLANGAQPYTDEEAQNNNIQTNVNFLEATKLLLDARRQFNNAFLKPGNFFCVTVDYGPKHKRKNYGKIITRELNKILKTSKKYLELLRSQFASVVLHGIGPAYWPDRERWEPDPMGIEDVLIPSGTLLDMGNLQHFATFQQLTAAQLFKLTQGPRVDPAWNIPLVNKSLKWAMDNYTKDAGYTDYYSPEKVIEAYKQDLGFYGSDAVPTIDCWNFYFWNDSKKHSGWNRRIVLDTSQENARTSDRRSLIDSRNEFLYDSGDRVYGQKLDQIIHFQFGDLSAVAPFRYHSVRSLGYLVFAVCHLQNRLRCKYADHVFENLMQFFRVANQDELQRVRKLNLVHMGVVPNDLAFVTQAERWQIDRGLVETAIEYNHQMIGESSASFTADYDFGRHNKEETATRTMMKAQSASQMVGALLGLAYEYQQHQYKEISRRFCIKGSKDADVRKFRLAVLKESVPEEAICVDYWNIDAERVLGGGNKSVELNQAQQLMAARPLYDPDAQRLILRDYTLATTDDPGRTEQLVPLEVNHISDSVHDAELGVGTLLAGLKVTPKPGMNFQEYIEVWLTDLGKMVADVDAKGGMTSAEKIKGFTNMSAHIEQYIQLFAQDPEQKQRVKQYSDVLGQINNLIKAFAQRLAEAQQKQMQQAGGNGGVDPESIAKAQATAQQAQLKMQTSQMSHAQKTMQKQQSWQADETRKQQDHEMEMRRQFDQNALDQQQQKLDMEQQRQQNHDS